jgi:nitrate/nitrite transporter NarK
VIIAIGLAVVPGIIASNRANAEISEVPSVVAKIQKLYNNQSSFSGVTTGQVAALSVYPDQEASAVGGTITDRWGGAVTVASGTLKVAGDSVILTYNNVPQAECTQIVPGVANSVRVITIGGTSVKADGQAVNLTTVGSQCAAGSTANTITYQFSK